MLITDLLEDINRFGEDEIEFYLIDDNGEMKKLELHILDDGRYLYKKLDENGESTDVVILGLNYA